MKKLFGIFLGVLLIFGGLITGLNSLGITNINISFDGWWAFFIIVPSFKGLLKNKDKIGNLIVLLIGVYLFLAAREIIEYGMFWNFLAPVVIILIGIKIIIKCVADNNTSKPEMHNLSKGEKVD